MKNLIAAALAADVPLLLWGPPGTGKTAAINALARDAGAHVETLIGSTLDPTDVSGQPFRTANGVEICPPAWAVRLKTALDAGAPAWLFLDELSCTPPSVQAALLRVVHDRQVAGVDLSGCRVVAAANRADTAADGGVLSGATANRWAHVDWALDVAAWVAGEASGWGQPRTPAHHAAAARVTEFVRRHPDSLLVVPENNMDDQSGAWPSPRSWSHAARLLAHVVSPADRRASVAACVGAAAADQFSAWETALDLPDPADLLAGTARLPKRGDQASAALAAMCAHVRGLTDREPLSDSFWRVVAQARDDVAIPAAKQGLDMFATLHPVAKKLGNKLQNLGVK